MQHTCGGGFSDRDRTGDTDDVRHLGVFGAEEALLRFEQPLCRGDIHRQQARQRQIDFLDLCDIKPVVHGPHPRDFLALEGHRRVFAQGGPLRARESAVRRKGLELAAWLRHGRKSEIYLTLRNWLTNCDVRTLPRRFGQEVRRPGNLAKGRNQIDIRLKIEESLAMTVPIWVLLAFAIWTLVVLMAGIGIRRWTLILTGNAQLTDFPGDTTHGSAAYRRAVRAHANCVENLPVYGAIVLAAFAAGAGSPTLDTLALVFIAARICQSLVHTVLVETNATVLIRFLFFLAQIVAMLWMAAEVVRHASA